MRFFSNEFPDFNFSIAESSLFSFDLEDNSCCVAVRELYSSSEYVVSNSVNEGCHLTVCEGALCGCKPLIYDWLGAKHIYDFATYYNTKSFWELIDDYPHKTRTFLRNSIIDKFQDKKVFETIDNVLFEAAREWM